MMLERKDRKPPKDWPPVSMQLFRALLSYPGSLTSLAEETGVSLPVMHRFLQGVRDIRLETAAKLCEGLGLELKPKGKK